MFASIARAVTSAYGTAGALRTVTTVEVAGISYAVEFHTGVIMPYFTVQSCMPGAPRNGHTYLSCRETATVILRRELRRRGLARDPRPEAVNEVAERLHALIAISRERFRDEAEERWNTPPVVL